MKELIKKVKNRKGDDIDDEEDSPMEQLDKFKSKLGDIAREAPHPTQVLMEHELADLNALFKKFNAQLERFENHYKFNFANASHKELDTFLTRILDLDIRLD